MQQGSDLGRAIQVRRAELGLKRKDLASRAKLSYPYLSELENGAKAPSARALGQLAEALELPVAELMARAEDAAAREQPDVGYGATEGAPSAGAAAAMFTLPTNFRVDRQRNRVRIGEGHPIAPPGRGGPTADQRLAELVAVTVRAELNAWARTELPEVVRLEVERAMAERETGDAV